MNIWFATNNAHKKQELQAILDKPLKIPAEEGINFNPEETGNTFCENALLKARELKKLLKGKNDLVISDDSGLCVDALDGRPGVYSACYGETSGIKLTSDEKNILLLNELKDNPKRSAFFVCTLVLLFDFDRFYIVQETLNGEIVNNKVAAKGSGGFGYDPIFFLPDFHRTLAELSTEEKNNISHRGKAGKIIAGLIKNI